MEDHLGDVLDCFDGDAVALLDSERMVRVGDAEAGALAYRLGLNVQLEVDGVSEEEEIIVEPAGEGRFLLASGDVPEIVGAHKAFGADFSPDAPYKGRIETVDGNENAAAEEELLSVDDALICRQDHPLFQFILRYGEDGLGGLDAVLEGQNIVPLTADRAGKPTEYFSSHSFIVPQKETGEDGYT